VLLGIKKRILKENEETKIMLTCSTDSENGMCGNGQSQRFDHSATSPSNSNQGTAVNLLKYIQLFLQILFTIRFHTVL
jgi:hypothetical protein